MTDEKRVAVYLRESRRKQDHRGQFQDLKRWMDLQKEPFRGYKDSSTVTATDRPGWAKLEADLEAGKIGKIVVWRLDRLGRTASELTALFERLRAAKIGLVSLKESLGPLHSGRSPDG